ncbi:MAG: tetratricopeptide repeat protein [Myxococcota bacterium]
MAFYSGQRLGPYALQYPIGAGGVAQVWAARHDTLQVPVALKILHQSSTANRARLLREGRAQTSLRHPNILPVRDIIDVSGGVGLVLPLVEGISLQTLLKTMELTEDEIRALIRQLLEGAQHAHQAGFIHRDLKPSNILLDVDIQGVMVRIADFGLVKGDADEHHTETGVGMGTPRYAAPEQLLDASAVDHRADLFSVGVILVEMLTGIAPFSADRLRNPSAARHEQALDALPPRWVALCESLLQYLPASRPQDCATVLAQLDAIPTFTKGDPLRHDGRLAQRIRRSHQIEQDARARTIVPLSEDRTVADTGTDANNPLHNLPPQYDRFIGRSRAVQTLNRLLRRGHRLITISGPGGVGKTRFALYFGQYALEDYRGGVWFCDLSDARGPDDVATAVARALLVHTADGDAVRQIGGVLASMGRTLIILDNVEQIVSDIRTIADAWRRHAPNVVFLLTSRARVGMAGEQMLPLAPLDATDALSLFVARAQQRQPEFVVDADNREVLAEIVRRLDQLPLAIELAAARVELFGVRGLREQDPVRLQDAQRAVPRHTTLHQTIEWSWDLLEPWEQSAFCQLSVFDGGFTLAAAEAILNRDGWTPLHSAMDAVQALLDRSLLRRLTSPARTGSRFGMLASTQTFARQKLRMCMDCAPDRVKGRHMAYFAQMGRGCLSNIHRSDATRNLEYVAEVANLRAALRWALEIVDAESIGLLALAIAQLGRGALLFSERLGVMEAALAHVTDPELTALRVRLLHQLGDTCRVSGQPERAERLLNEALEHARCRDAQEEIATSLLMRGQLRDFYSQPGAVHDLDAALRRFQQMSDRLGEAKTLLDIASVLLKEGETQRAEALTRSALQIFTEEQAWYGEARASKALAGVLNLRAQYESSEAHFLHALRLFRDGGAILDEGRTSNNLGNCYRAQGLFSRAESFYRAALKIYRQSGERLGEGLTLNNLGSVLSNQGRFLEAREAFQRSLQILRPLKDTRRVVSTLNNLGVLLFSQGELTAAQETLEEGLVICRGIPYPRLAALMTGNLGEMIYHQGQLSKAEMHLQDALQMHIRMEDPLLEGSTLGTLGRIYGDQGRVEEGRALMVRGETVLRQTRAGDCLAHLLCERVLFEASHDRSLAEAALREARALAGELSLTRTSRLMQHIARAEHALQRS